MYLVLLKNHVWDHFKSHVLGFYDKNLEVYTFWRISEYRGNAMVKIVRVTGLFSVMSFILLHVYDYSNFKVRTKDLIITTTRVDRIVSIWGFLYWKEQTMPFGISAIGEWFICWDWLIMMIVVRPTRGISPVKVCGYFLKFQVGILASNYVS